jgi:RHS repeat-associated protein
MLLTGDFNGDGRDDLAIGQYACLGGDCHGPNQYYSALASSSATELPFSGGGGFLEQDVAVLADLNGDGTTDLITGGGGQPANYRPEICKAGTCTGVWTPTSGATLPYVGDFDGDGLVDLIGPVTPANNPPTWGYLPNNSKTGFAAQYVSINTSYASTQTWNAYVNDYNGAGKAELIFWNSALLQNGTPSTFMHMLADTTSGALTTSLKASGKSLLSVRYQFADLNGDGLPDAIEIPNAGGDVRIAINTGRGFLPPKPANLNSDSMFGESSFRDPGIRIVDVNLDGRADILYLGDGCRGDGASSRSKIITLAADNDRDGSVSLVPDVSPYDHGWGTYPGNGVTCYGFDGSQVLDANGDGLADFIQAEGDDYQLMLYQRQGQPPGLLTNVRDGYGATVDVTYAPMSDSTVYTRIECSYPQICNQKGRWLVSSHTFDKGTSTERPLTHTYVGARADITGIGWLGMDRHTVTDGAITTTVDYDLDPSQNDDQVKTYPKIGRPVQKQEVFNDPPASALARTSIFDLGFHNVGFGDGNGRTWWRVVWDSDGVTTEETQHTQDNSQPPVIANRVIRKTSESRTYDPDFGYIKTRNGSKWGEGDGNGGDFEQESWVPSYYDDDEGNWLVGRLKREEAHSTIEGVEGVRVTSYELDPNTNALLSTIIEPDSGDPNLYKKTKLTRNLTGQVWKTDEYVLDPTTLTPTVARSTQVLQFDPVSGFPAFTRNALGQVTSRVYHPWLGVVVSETDANGLETRRKYDGFGRLRWEKTPDGGLTEMNYNAQDQTEPGALALLQVEATQNGVGPTLYYDAAGRLVRQVKLDENPNPYQTVIQYDKYGREVSKWRPYPGTKGNVVQSLPHLNTTYDSLGRPTLQEFVSGNPPTVSSRKSWTYDGLSTVAVESGLGLGPDKTTGTITGGGGRVFRATELVTVKGAGGTNETKLVTTQFFYRPFGQLGKVLVDQSNETDMTYDARGRRRTVKDGDTGTTTSDYDAFDQLTKETYQDTNWVSRSYDALGRMTSETTKGGGTNTTIWDASANGIGRVSVRTSMDGVATEFDYDAAGRASGETWRFGAEAHRVDYAHDQYGRLSRITYPDVAAQRRAVYYGYDPWTGEQSSASLGDSSGPKKMLWSVQARDFDRHILSESFGDGSEQHSVYGDPRGLLTSRSSLMAETDTGTTVGFTYDARGYLASRQQYLSDQGETFTHDEMGRLTTWQSTGGGANWKVEYGYDSIGNLLSREESLDGTSQGATTFVTGSTNQCQNPAGPHAITTVTSAGTTQCYEYDARGQQTSGADGRAVSYTEYGLPTQITRDGVQWQFGYDATHRRARKTGPAGSTIYVGSLYEKRVATDGTESHVMYVLAGGDVKAQIVVDGASGGQKIDYLMRDHLASVTRTGGDGVWQDMRFDPYGGRIATAPPPTPISESPSSRVRLGFTGQEEDDDLGLVNMNGRIYDPAIARFLTPDPVVAMRSPSQSWNRYSYAENSPLRFVDPSGFDPQDGSGGNGPPPGVHMECTSAFNCGYMTSSGVYLTQDNWNYWSGNYSTSPAGPNVGSFDEAGAGASAGITYGMAVASKDGESQGGGGSVGQSTWICWTR